MPFVGGHVFSIVDWSEGTRATRGFGREPTVYVQPVKNCSRGTAVYHTDPTFPLPLPPTAQHPQSASSVNWAWFKVEGGAKLIQPRYRLSQSPAPHSVLQHSLTLFRPRYVCCLLFVRCIDMGSPLNPGGIVPIGPSVEDLGLEEAAGRGSQDRSAVFYQKECITSPPHFGHDG